MRSPFLIIPAILIFQAMAAQTGPSTGEGTITIAAATASPTTEKTIDETPVKNPSLAGQTLIMDYKSVYESATAEEEVKTATERFNLTASQQDTWLLAAADRRLAEKNASAQFEKDPNSSKDGMYKGIRTAQNTFYETIIAYLTPAQKHSLEADRVIMEEKRKRVAKLPPVAPITPSVTVAPVDSAAIYEAEKVKLQEKKKSKSKKKAVAP